ncbi:unnamed protein product (macronuclear) [Paramecium tetraurelia]|uniref:Replication factor C subunit 1 n=1 Tax=Paramecium tetraurelia TaxID=5888 RepID=A0BPL7_PARTE|nr:uncharacterized protein GSPATT00005233001 [Paramecium tetraurelia]CAK60484.1 unnamed protein product [Paramecium tetraurelia]|eukprot:XP_001427882.1 hypothetical protein (macronuclear) [Paramecium tetraurelia strain d4-2]
MRKRLIKASHLEEEKPRIEQPITLQQDSSSDDSDQEDDRKQKYSRLQFIDENKQQQLDRFLQKGNQGQNVPQPKKQKVIEFKMVEETKQTTNQKDEEKRCDLSDDQDSDFDLPTNFKHLAGITRTSTTTTQATQLLKVTSQPSDVEIKSFEQDKRNQFEQEHVQVAQIEIEEDSHKNTASLPLEGKSYYILGNLGKYVREDLVKIIKLYGGFNKCRVLQDTILLQGSLQNNGKSISNSQHLKDAQKYKNLILDEEGFNNYLISYTGNDLQKSYQLACKDNQLNGQEIKEQSDQQQKQQSQQSSQVQKSQPQQLSKQPTNQAVQEVKSNLRAKFDSEVVIVEKQVELKPEIVNFSKNKQIQEEQKKVQKIEQIMVEDTKQKCQLWTNKYAPSKVSDCLDQTHVPNIVKWLDKWGKPQLEICPGSFQSQNFAAKALLLSGPPGIGKTTIIRLIAKQKSYQLIEWNASDVRSKLQIENYVKHLQDNTVLRFKDANLISEGKTIILMDEVDGMTGSDRGGNKCLIDMIRLTKVPIVCICNDRNKQSMRSLANYCLDLQFKKPNQVEIFKKLEYICKSENISYDPAELKQQIEVSQCDIRQLLNLLQMHKVGLKLHIDKNIGKDGSVTTNLYESTRMLLNYKDSQNLPIHKLMDFYFQDPDMTQFFYHENYLDLSLVKKTPSNSIQNISLAASSLADADVLNTKVRSQMWGLMPNVGFLSTMYPTQILKGNILSKVNFPQMLGKISSENKIKRQILEVKEAFASQTYLTNTKAIKFQYIEPFSFFVIQSLASAGLSCIDEIVTLLKTYNLNIQQFEECIVGSLALFPKRDLMTEITSQVRTALNKAMKQSMDSADRLGKDRRAIAQTNFVKKTKNNEDDLNEEFNQEEENDEDDQKQKKNTKQKNINVKQQEKPKKKEEKPQTDKNKQKKKGKK